MVGKEERERGKEEGECGVGRGGKVGMEVKARQGKGTERNGTKGGS